MMFGFVPEPTVHTIVLIVLALAFPYPNPSRTSVAALVVVRDCLPTMATQHFPLDRPPATNGESAVDTFVPYRLPRERDLSKQVQMVRVQV